MCNVHENYFFVSLDLPKINYDQTQLIHGLKYQWSTTTDYNNLGNAKFGFVNTAHLLSVTILYTNYLILIFKPLN